MSPSTTQDSAEERPLHVAGIDREVDQKVNRTFLATLPTLRAVGQADGTGVAESLRLLRGRDVTQSEL